ncbi:hypothetical protein L484_014250 [Morus notabilis]|uniref:Uncharacterized protein n=1 Tax=Morus notabilis TaxID=981085 RepID=W9RYA8_9ROSA|nr:hypothetical protein L484_014250 [Morus notabilis]
MAAAAAAANWWALLDERAGDWERGSMEREATLIGAVADVLVGGDELSPAGGGCGCSLYH